MMKRKNNRESTKVLRIEEIEKKLRESGEDVDPESIVSMYMPRRRLKILGKAFLRLDKMQIALILLTMFIMGLFIVAFLQEKMGNFTINLNRLELFRKGVAISADGEFTDPTARLIASAVRDATNISIDDLPNNLSEIDGDHNGRNYVAYTYYVRNAGKEDVSYKAVITLDNASKNAENAARVAVWKNGEKTVYAEPGEDGKPEKGCKNFLSHNLVCEYTEDEFLVGNVDKYTIVIWLEGDDSDCVDKIVGGSLEFSMNLDAEDDSDDSLLVRYIRDIKDALNNNNSINAAGNEAPSYYHEGEITWENRRNQD